MRPRGCAVLRAGWPLRSDFLLAWRAALARTRGDVEAALAYWNTRVDS